MPRTIIRKYFQFPPTPLPTKLYYRILQRRHTNTIRRQSFSETKRIITTMLKSSSRPELLLNVKSKLDNGYANAVKTRTTNSIEELGLHNKLKRRFDNTSKGMAYTSRKA